MHRVGHRLLLRRFLIGERIGQRAEINDALLYGLVHDRSDPGKILDFENNVSLYPVGSGLSVAIAAAIERRYGEHARLYGVLAQAIPLGHSNNVPQRLRGLAVSLFQLFLLSGNIKGQDGQVRVAFKAPFRLNHQGVGNKLYFWLLGGCIQWREHSKKQNRQNSQFHGWTLLTDWRARVVGMLAEGKHKLKRWPHRYREIEEAVDNGANSAVAGRPEVAYG